MLQTFFSWWEIGSLDKYLSANPDIRIMMQRYLACDLAGKFMSQAATAAYKEVTRAST